MTEKGDSTQLKMQHDAECLSDRLFDVLLVIKLDEPSEEDSHLEKPQLKVHFGKDPSVRLQTDPDHYVDLLFTGDMERQIFIWTMWEEHEKRVSLDNHACSHHHSSRQHIVDVDSDDSTIQQLGMSVHPTLI